MLKSVSFPFTFGITCPALPMPLFSPIGTFFSISMAVFTTGPHIAFPTSYISPLSHSFKMLRVYASRFSAKMIENVSFRNSPFMDFVGEAVREVILLFKPELSVLAFRTSPKRSRPNPALFCFSNLFKEFRELTFHGHCIPQSTLEIKDYT